MMARNRNSESGNVFLIVMISIVLFAALMFNFSRTARHGGDSLSEKQKDLAAADIATYAQDMEKAVNEVLMHSVSENDISFENDIEAGYANAACTTLRCRIFSPTGGALGWENPPPGVNDGSNWVITGRNAVPGAGDNTRPDLVLILPKVTADFCLRINDNLGVTNPSGQPPDDADGIDLTPFTGTYTLAETIGTAADLDKIAKACVLNRSTSPDTYLFYAVLIGR